MSVPLGETAVEAGAPAGIGELAEPDEGKAMEEPEDLYNVRNFSL